MISIPHHLSINLIYLNAIHVAYFIQLSSIKPVKDNTEPHIACFSISRFKVKIAKLKLKNKKIIFIILQMISLFSFSPKYLFKQEKARDTSEIELNKIKKICCACFIHFQFVIFSNICSTSGLHFFSSSGKLRTFSCEE